MLTIQLEGIASGLNQGFVEAVFMNCKAGMSRRLTAALRVYRMGHFPRSGVIFDTRETDARTGTYRIVGTIEPKK